MRGLRNAYCPTAPAPTEASRMNPSTAPRTRPLRHHPRRQRHRAPAGTGRNRAARPAPAWLQYRNKDADDRAARSAGPRAAAAVPAPWRAADRQRRLAPGGGDRRRRRPSGRGRRRACCGPRRLACGRDPGRVLLRRPVPGRACCRGRRRLHRLRRVLPVADQAQRPPRRPGPAARLGIARTAAGGDRRHHAGQCVVPWSRPAPTCSR